MTMFNEIQEKYNSKLDMLQKRINSRVEHTVWLHTKIHGTVVTSSPPSHPGIHSPDYMTNLIIEPYQL